MSKKLEITAVDEMYELLYNNNGIDCDNILSTYPNDKSSYGGNCYEKQRGNYRAKTFIGRKR